MLNSLTVLNPTGSYLSPASLPDPPCFAWLSLFQKFLFLFFTLVFPSSHFILFPFHLPPSPPKISMPFSFTLLRSPLNATPSGTFLDQPSQRYQTPTQSLRAVPFFHPSPLLNCQLPQKLDAPPNWGRNSEKTESLFSLLMLAFHPSNPMSVSPVR